MDSSSKHKAAAFAFMRWATSPQYINLVAKKFGWENVAPGTRYALYTNPNYLKVAPWASVVLNSINNANIKKPTMQPVPYTGTAQQNIAPFASYAADFGQDFGAMVTGQTSVAKGLAQAQQQVTAVMKQAGYLK